MTTLGICTDLDLEGWIDYVIVCRPLALKCNIEIISRGVGRWFDKGGLYESIGKGSMIIVHNLA
jgi:hypothetical protein